MENKNRKMLEKLNKTALFFPESIHYYYYYCYYHSLSPSLPLLPDRVAKLWSYGTKEFYENPTHPKQNRKRETTKTNQDFSSSYLLLLLLLL
jgi:hypothetical protein